MSRASRRCMLEEDTIGSVGYTVGSPCPLCSTGAVSNIVKPVAVPVALKTDRDATNVNTSVNRRGSYKLEKENNSYNNNKSSAVSADLASGEYSGSYNSRPSLTRKSKPSVKPQASRFPVRTPAPPRPNHPSSSPSVSVPAAGLNLDDTPTRPPPSTAPICTCFHVYDVEVGEDVFAPIIPGDLSHSSVEVPAVPVGLVRRVLCPGDWIRRAGLLYSAGHTEAAYRLARKVGWLI